MASGDPQFAWKPRSETKRIIVHESHTGPSITNTVAWLRANGRANGLLEVGYHLVVERDGSYAITRPLHALGSHAPSANHDSIGICLAHEPGEEMDLEQPAAERSKWWTLWSLYGYLTTEYWADLPVYGHDEAVRRRPTPNHPRCPSFDMERLRQFLGAPNVHRHDPV